MLTGLAIPGKERPSFERPDAPLSRDRHRTDCLYPEMCGWRVQDDWATKGHEGVFSLSATAAVP